MRFFGYIKKPLFWIEIEWKELAQKFFEDFVTPFSYMSQLFFLGKKFGGGRLYEVPSTRRGGQVK